MINIERTRDYIITIPRFFELFSELHAQLFFQPASLVSCYH